MIIAPDTLELRPRQIAAKDSLFDAMRKGYRVTMLVMPTGAGKRYIAVWLCQTALEKGRRVLFVTNRRLLVEQMFAEAENFGVEHGVMMSGNEYRSADVQIASIQTLESRHVFDSIGDATGHGLPPADLVIIDEGHNDIERYVQLLRFYPNAKVVVLTATPLGPEGKSLVPTPYEIMVEGCLNSELIADGLLLPTKVYAPSEPNIEGVKIVKRQEYNQSQLGRAVKECTVFADVFKDFMPFADRQFVCFVPGIAFGYDLERQMNAWLGTGKVRVYCSKTKTGEREEILDGVKAGDIKGLISVDCLREGFDLPQISLGIDLQPNTQLRTYWQKVGRIKRAYEGQTDAVLLDFAGNYWKFPHPDNDPEWPTGEETSQEAIQRNRKAGKERQPIMCPKCSFVRERGPRCPQCGHEAGEPIRRIRMGNGKVKEVSARVKEKVEKSAEHKLLGKWKGLLFAGLKKNWSFGQCQRFYRDSTGEWPKDGWPGVFASGSLAWRRKVPDDLTPARIMIQCKEIERRMR